MLETEWDAPFLSCFFLILGAGEYSLPQESKGSVCFSANIADMRIHFKSFVIVTTMYLMFSRFSRTVSTRV